MPKPVFRRLTNGELKLDYTEAARSIKLSRSNTKKDAAQNKSQAAEEVGIKSCEIFIEWCHVKTLEMDSSFAS